MGVKKDRGEERRRIIGVEEKDCRGRIVGREGLRVEERSNVCRGKEQLWVGREKDYRWRRRIVGGKEPLFKNNCRW